MYRSKDKTTRISSPKRSETRFNNKLENKVRTSHGMRENRRKNSQLSGYSSQMNVELSGFNQGFAITNSQSKLLTPPNEEVKVSSGQMEDFIAQKYPSSYDNSPYISQANQVTDHQTHQPFSSKGNDSILVVQSSGGYFRIQKNPTDEDDIKNGKSDRNSRKLPDI